MEQRVADLEKKVQELEAALNESKEAMVQALTLISSQMEHQLSSLINDYKNGFKEVTLKLIAEAKRDVDFSDGKYQLFIRDEPAALGNSVNKLIEYYHATKSKEMYKIVDRSTGATAITNAWQFDKGEIENVYETNNPHR